jgi:hypothetical protein
VLFNTTKSLNNRIPEHWQSIFTKIIIPASIIHAFVGIALFGVNTSVFLNVFESEVHKTAIAAMVAVTGRAINQVLLAQRNKFSCFIKKILILSIVKLH